MGQYYRPIIVADNKTSIKAFLYSWDYGNGAKLMEHSWQGNDFVSAFETLIYKNPQRVVWAGDYADDCKGRKTNLNTRSDNKEKLKLMPTEHLSVRRLRYVINHNKKQYVDKVRVPKGRWGWKIHPLPLLTAEGNNRGGGDYRQADPNGLIGSWARDLISVSGNRPKSYTEIEFNLIEE